MNCYEAATELQGMIDAAEGGTAAAVVDALCERAEQVKSRALLHARNDRERHLIELAVRDVLSCLRNTDKTSHQMAINTITQLKRIEMEKWRAR